MTKKERQMLLAIYEHSNVVPNVANNMSTGDLARFRFDSLELQGFIRSLSYSLLMVSSGESAGDFKKAFEAELKDLKAFVAHRAQEGWNYETSYLYKHAHIW